MVAVVGGWVLYRPFLVISFSQAKPQANHHSDLLLQNLIISLTPGINNYLCFIFVCVSVSVYTKRTILTILDPPCLGFLKPLEKDVHLCIQQQNIDKT